MMNGWNPFLGYLRTLDQYILGSLADPWNAGIIIFTLTIGGIVGIMTKMGGAQAVSTTALVAGLALMSTWIGYEIRLIKDIYETMTGGPVMLMRYSYLLYLTDSMKYLL